MYLFMLDIFLNDLVFIVYYYVFAIYATLEHMMKVIFIKFHSSN